MKKPVKRVYPRACGGTTFAIVLQICYLGLSPRLRGNVSILGFTIVKMGSIPALAGER